jgi:hypothetical protein
VVCEGPLLTVLLNKMETLLDQVCVYQFSSLNDYT